MATATTDALRGEQTQAPAPGRDLVLVAGLVVVVLAALALRLPHLTANLPQLVHPDEPTTVGRALDVLEGDLTPPEWDWPPGSAYVLAAALAGAEVVAPGLDAGGEGAYRIGRYLFLAVSLALVAATGVLGAAVAPGERWSRRLVAWLAAAAVAVSFTLVRLGRISHPDELQALLVVASVLVTVRLLRRGEDARGAGWVVALAALLAGFAAATKYVGIIAALPLVVVIWRRASTASRPRLLVVAVGVAVAGFVAGTLGTVLDLGTFWPGFRDQFLHQAGGHLGYESDTGGPLFHLVTVLPGTWGIGLALLALGSAVAVAVRGRLAERLLLIPVVLVLGLATLTRVRFPHYLLLALPFLAVLAGLGADRARRLVGSGSRWGDWAGGLAAVTVVVAAGLTLVPPVLDDLRLVRAAGSPDTRVLALEEIRRLPADVRVLGEPYTAAGDRAQAVAPWGVVDAMADDPRACDCVALISSYQEDRYRRRPDLYADEIAAYDRMRAEGEPLAVIFPGRPLAYNWDILPAWGLGTLPLTGPVGATGPTVTVLDLRN